jgi:RNA polymerase subunit RPABC4/transcription elongation factor Spt4
LLSTEKFCPECGCEVKQDSVKTQPCRECHVLVVEGQKFCSNCKWKIDPAIFKGM